MNTPDPIKQMVLDRLNAQYHLRYRDTFAGYETTILDQLFPTAFLNYAQEVDTVLNKIMAYLKNHELIFGPLHIQAIENLMQPLRPVDPKLTTAQDIAERYYLNSDPSSFVVKAIMEALDVVL
jgi:hypothetical protein